MSNKTAMSECIRNGFQIYPVHKNGNWYIRVDFKGKLHKMGEKVIGKGSILKGKKFEEVIQKTYEYYYKNHIK